MGLNMPMREQFRVDVPRERGRLAMQRKLGFSAAGKPEALFIYRPGRDRINELEVACDIFLHQHRNEAGEEVTICVGLELLCPKCGMALHVNGATLPDGRDIEIHWDQMIRSQGDGLYRPAVTVHGGSIGCDYYDAEASDVPQPRLVSRCRWRGVIEGGRGFDAGRKIVHAR